MAKCIMVQGTMSGVGKSLLTAALCRIFHQDGYRVAPFKSQNMALNSYITENGLEMSRAQAVQAQAAGIMPDVRMNPILLKPSSDTGSQLILHGIVQGDYRARDYFSRKKALIPEILASYQSLSREFDIIVIEGAGSPAEINLKKDDIVNMGLAELVNAPVLLVGDIDRGGVFAQLYGTVALLEPVERQRIIGTVINKFRGDPALLQPGLTMLEEKTKLPVLGVVPYTDVDIEDEDSLAPRLDRAAVPGLLDVAVIRLPRMANFTDFAPLERHAAFSVRYVKELRHLGRPDLVIIPGTKSTMDDLLWMRKNGLEIQVKRMAEQGVPVIGICGGFQMLGAALRDPSGVERGGTMNGMGLLACETEFAREKTRTQRAAVIQMAPFTGMTVHGYETHMGQTERGELMPFCLLSDRREDGASLGAVFGTYLHGLFDTAAFTDRLASWLLERNGKEQNLRPSEDQADYRERQFALLADTVRESLDMQEIYRQMTLFHAGGG